MTGPKFERPELFGSVEQAQGLLAELKARLEQQDAGSVPRELIGNLDDLRALMQKLQTRHGLLLQILDRTNDMVCAKERDGRYAMINPRGAELLGKTVPEILGSDDRGLLTAPDAERVMAIDREVMRSRVPQTREEILVVGGTKTTLITTTNTWQDVEDHVRGVIGIAQDVTDRRQDERESALQARRLRSMATELVMAEERLRRSLAADLHSGLGQDIALTRLKLSSLRSTIDADEMHRSLIGIEQLVAQADSSLRSITFQITPPSLHDLGLVEALQWLAEDLGARYRIEVRILDGDSPAVDDEGSRVLLFRAVRELLVNAARHANVSEVVVRLARQGDSILILVEDLGSGFLVGDREQHGYGLFGIREQLKYIDGTLEVASTPGSGTTVTLTVPVASCESYRPG